MLAISGEVYIYIYLNVCWGGFGFRERLKRVLRYFCLMSEFTLDAYIHNTIINNEKQSTKGPHNSSQSSHFKMLFETLSLLLQTKHKCETNFDVKKCLKSKSQKDLTSASHLWAALLIFPLISTMSTWENVVGMRSLGDLEALVWNHTPCSRVVLCVSLRNQWFSLSSRAWSGCSLLCTGSPATSKMTEHQSESSWWSRQRRNSCFPNFLPLEFWHWYKGIT